MKNGVIYYDEQGYDCPNCGHTPDALDIDPDNPYGKKCTECGHCFETPDS